MIILRRKTKSFTDLNIPPELTSNDINSTKQTQIQNQKSVNNNMKMTIENMRTERQRMINTRQMQRLRAEKSMMNDKLVNKQITEAQKQEAARDLQDNKNQIKVKKMESSEDKPNNVNLYKTVSKVPVTRSMN